MNRKPNQSRQPTPGERLRFNRAPWARRGWARRYMSAAALGILQGTAILLLCAQGFCGTTQPAAPVPDSLQTLAGTFESVARGDSFFGGGTTNAKPLFTLTLRTNGTYFVFCASVDIEPHMDGGHSFLRPGNEFGTWRWDPHHSEVVFTATNRSHMTEVFPTHMKVDLRDLNRLIAINTAPPRGLIRHPWFPLNPPDFCRKVP